MNKKLILLQYRETGRTPQGNELLVALRGLYKYAQFDFDIYMLGEGSKMLRGTEFEHIPVIEGCHDEFPNCRGQHIRVARDLYLAYSLFHKQYDEFLLMSDDFYSINNFTWEDCCIPKYIDEHIKGTPNVPRTYWRYAKWKTGNVLRQNGFKDYNYTSHTFQVYSFEHIKEIIEQFRLTEQGYDFTIEDVYFNYYEPIKQVHATQMRMGVWKREDGAKIEQAKKDGLKWISMSEEGFTKENLKKIENIVNG